MKRMFLLMSVSMLCSPVAMGQTPTTLSKSAVNSQGQSVSTASDLSAAFGSKVDTTSGASTGQSLATPTISGTVSGSGNISSLTAIATGSTTGRNFAARFSEMLNIRDGCGVTGAVGDGVADDSPAIAACINLAVTKAAAGAPVAVYFPGGIYLVKNTQIPTATRGVGLVGDGLHQSYVKIDTTYSGTLFSWTEAWTGSGYGGPSLSPSSDLAGPFAQGLTIIGNTTSSAQQDAFVFYGRNDFVTFRDIGVFFLNGQCLKTGSLSGALTTAYVRESQFDNLWCWNAGTATAAAVEISSTTVSGSDATNEVRFWNPNIFAAASVGMSIHNPTAFSATRLIELFSPRVESSGKDNIQIGATGDLGATNSIRLYGLQSISPGISADGYFGLNIGIGAAIQTYDVQVMGGQIGPCITTLCKGLNIDNVRLANIAVENISTTGTNVTYTANAGTNVVLDSNGVEQNYTYSIDAAAENNVHTQIYRNGDPSITAVTPSITAVGHDGTTKFGNAVGQGGVDLQFGRNQATQVATQFAALIGGTFNTAGGLYGGVFAGNTNNTSGTAGFIGAGLQASDRSRYASQTFASGRLAANGDAQIGTFVLRGTGATTSAFRLTADNATAGSANCVNIPNNSAFSVVVNVMAFDHTTVSKNETWTLWSGLLTRGANAASTALTMASTPTPLTNGTVTGSAIAATADTTNGCLNISFTPPTSNTDTWNVVAKVETVEVL